MITICLLWFFIRFLHHHMFTHFILKLSKLFSIFHYLFLLITSIYTLLFPWFFNTLLPWLSTSFLFWLFTSLLLWLLNSLLFSFFNFIFLLITNWLWFCRFLCFFAHFTLFTTIRLQHILLRNTLLIPTILNLTIPTSFLNICF